MNHILCCHRHMLCLASACAARQPLCLSPTRHLSVTFALAMVVATAAAHCVAVAAPGHNPANPLFGLQLSLLMASDITQSRRQVVLERSDLCEPTELCRSSAAWLLHPRQTSSQPLLWWTRRLSPSCGSLRLRLICSWSWLATASEG